jgi:transcriptional regulator with XRE-family HTH domain
MVFVKGGFIEMQQFTQALKDTMEERNMSIKDLAQVCGITYEHARRFSHGINIPTDALIHKLCDHLELDCEQWKAKANADRITARFGTIPASLARPESCIDLLEGVWQKLTVDQQDGIIEQATAMAAANTKKATRARA